MGTSWYIAILVTILLADGTTSTGFIANNHPFKTLGDCNRVIGNRDNHAQIYGSLQQHVGEQLVEAREIGCFTDESIEETNHTLGFTYQRYQGV